MHELLTRLRLQLSSVHKLWVRIWNYTRHRVQNCRSSDWANRKSVIRHLQALGLTGVLQLIGDEYIWGPVNGKAIGRAVQISYTTGVGEDDGQTSRDAPSAIKLWCMDLHWDKRWLMRGYWCQLSAAAAAAAGYPIIGSPPPPRKVSPGRQFTSKNPPRPTAARAGRIFAGKLLAWGRLFWGGAILWWRDFLWGDDTLIKQRRINYVIISSRADFSWKKHFNVTAVAAAAARYGIVSAWRSTEHL